MKRWILIIVGVAFFALIAFRLYEEWPASASPSGRPAAGFGRTVSATTAELGPVHEAVTLVGSLRAYETVDVMPKLSGRLLQVRVNIGDAVRRGQLLARLEDDQLKQQLQQSEAALQVNRALVQQRELELKNQAAILKRNQGLQRGGLISAEQLEQAQTRFEVAQAQLNLARAQLEQSEAGLRELQIRLDQTRLVSPIDGLVGRRYVDAGAQVNTSTRVVTLVNLDEVKLVAAVPEGQIAKVQVGATGTVHVDALPGEKFVGQVARISPLLDSQTRTAQVEVSIPNPGHRLKAEMFARVDLDLGSKRDALRIPRQALVLRGERQGVFVLEQDVARFRTVQVGLSEDDWVEVTSGVSPGETVATMGANLLRDGDRVRVSSAGRRRETSG